MDYNLFASAVDKTKLKNLKRVVFEGDRGDAGMHPDLLSYINFFDFAPSVILITNGSMRSESWWAELAKIPNLTVVWSIDGLVDTNHLYRVGLDFSKIINNAHSFINNGGKAIWKCIVFKHNEHQINEIVTFAKSSGFQSLAFAYPLAGRFDWQGSPVVEYPVFISGQQSHTIELPKKSKIQIEKIIYFKNINTFPALLPLRGIKSRCPWSQQGRIYITYHGYVIPCCMQHNTPDNILHNYEEDRKFLEQIGNLDNISLTHHNLESILSNHFYSFSLEDSLSDPQKIHHVCKNTCIKSYPTVPLTSF